ncbi:MAG: glycosyl amidation-associated protein WbuZ [Bacteroidota bacterium]|jgi:cyclase
MLRPRIIPCLLIQNGGLVKTTGFQDPKYVGDPINAVKIFNEKEVDELLVLDIDATRNNKEPNFDLIRKLAVECRMPFCYGGGVKTLIHAKKIINLGAEKVAISSSALNNLKLIEEIGTNVGTQSVVVVLDVRKRKNIFGSIEYEIYTLNGKIKSKYNLFEFVNLLNNIGIGELVINSIDNDGIMNGYDLELVDYVRSITDFPLTVLGGVGSLNHFGELFGRFGIMGAAAGSFFVFKGKFRAVLISYPTKEEVELLTKNIY